MTAWWRSASIARFVDSQHQISVLCRVRGWLPSAHDHTTVVALQPQSNQDEADKDGGDRARLLQLDDAQKAVDTDV
jgi:hypothetical protein